MLYSNVHSKLDLVIDAENHVPIHLHQIAHSCMYEWEGTISDQLGLRPFEVTEIKEYYPERQNLQAQVV